MKEEGISSSSHPLMAPKSSSPPPIATPAASSGGASSPAFPMNIDGAVVMKGAAAAASISRVIRTSPSTSSALGSSQPSCRPWDTADFLRRLSTFNNFKGLISLACARRGWVNVDIHKIQCDSCGANIDFADSATWTTLQVDKKLDKGHKGTCPWRGNSCAESLVQFPPSPPSALIGGFKDRCDGLLQFPSLPVVSASAIERMRTSRGIEIDRFLVQLHSLAGAEFGLRLEIMLGADTVREDVFFPYSRAQKLISLCGWEPRWLPNVQDCEEYSAQSARKGGSIVRSKYHAPPKDPGRGKKALSAKNKIKSRKEGQGPNCKGESRSPLLDCSLCGATVRIWDFLTVDRPACFTPNCTDFPETSKKMGLTRGASAASGISGWVAADGIGKNKIEDHDEVATADGGRSWSNGGIDLNLTMGGYTTTNVISEQYQVSHRGKGILIRQPSCSEVGNRAASYESRGPSSRKRNIDEGGSTVDLPQIVMQQADSIEGTIIDRDGDEVNDGRQYSGGPSKRVCETEAFETQRSLYRMDSDGAGPSQPFGFDMGTSAQRDDFFDIGLGVPSARGSTHASSVVAMDTVCHSADCDSMESVENYPVYFDDVHFPSTSSYRNADPYETSELNYSSQAQQSACPATARNDGEMGLSSTNDEEVVNADATTAHGRDVTSFGISGGSVGMGASHEAEIHGADASVYRADSGVGDVEPIAEITGEFASDPGLMGDYVPEGMDPEDPHGDSQDLMSHSVGRADSGSKVVGSAKAESVESGEKISNIQTVLAENMAHPSLSCNAVVCSGYEVSKEEVTQKKKALPSNDIGYVESGYFNVTDIGPPNGESNYEEAVEFDPIKHHNYFCPWVNGNVASAGCSSGSSSSSSASVLALCGWQLSLDALDAFQTLGHVPAQPGESESAASLYKDDHQTSRKPLAHHSFSKSCGQS